MSDADGFIQEVTEELRRDRMLKLWRRWGPLVIGGVVAIVVVSGVLEWRKQQAEEAARIAGAELLEAKESIRPEARALRFAEAADTLDAGPALAARLGEATASVEAGDPKKAVEILKAIAADQSVDVLYRDLAAFRAALYEAPDLDPLARAQSMTPFIVDDHPFRLLAREARAVASYQARDHAAARADVDDLMKDPMTSAAMRARLERLSQLLADQAPAAE